MTAITYSSQVLPASRISAKRQLAMLKDSHGTMVTAVAIVLRCQGFMAEEHDGNILLSCRPGTPTTSVEGTSTSTVRT